MRIGIYTQPLRLNYGGLLQAWALQIVLKRMGHQVVTFDPCPYLRLSWNKKPIAYANRLIRTLLRKPTTRFDEKKFNTEYDIKSQYLRPFIQTNIDRREFRRISELSATDYDVLIVGSDQVWRPKYNKYCGCTIENAFLDFARHWNVKRIAYAASFGTDEWEFSQKQTRYCSQLASLFSAISVRETSGIGLCKEHLNVEATHVLDPTLLLNLEDYEELIQRNGKTKSPSGNLLCHILDETEDTTVLIRQVASSKALVPFYTNFKRKRATAEEQIQPPMEQWLRNFQEAKFVVTDSFHACVFSIIFGKPFVVIGNKKRGVPRIESLLSTLCLKDHLIYSASDYKPELSYDLNPEVKTVLDKQRLYSLEFLEKSIK